MSDSDSLLETPLRAAHERLQAKMVPFAGWRMPVQYAGGISEEHHAVRREVGIFDISHMGEFIVTGPGAGAWLNGVLTNNIARLAPGQGQYTLMLNERGGVIDDLIVYCIAVDEYFLVVNASKIEEDWAWLMARGGADLLHDASRVTAAMAVQGPRAVDVFRAVLGEGHALPPRNGYAQLETPEGIVSVCRTGYTGEDGFEFFSAASTGEQWFDRFLAAGAKPCGLGARDTLRLEMGYPLNGNDLSPERTPLEAGLGFFVDLEKTAFVGRDVLVAQKANGLPSRLVGLQLIEKGPPPRAHYPVVFAGNPVGELSSGGLSPSTGEGIGMAYLPLACATPGTEVAVDIRGRAWAARVVKKPFYRPAKPTSPT
jgi:aminomethyltransferase